MAHYNEINVQNLYIACTSLEDYINDQVEKMNLGGGDYTVVLTRLSDQVLSLSNALQSADPDNSAVTLLKTLSNDFAVEAGKVEGTSYSEILTMINSLTAIVSVVKKKIAVPIRTSADSALEKKTGDMYYDQAVKKFAFVTDSDTGVATVSNFSVEGHKHTEADIDGLTEKLVSFQTQIDNLGGGGNDKGSIFSVDEKYIIHDDDNCDIYWNNAAPVYNNKLPYPSVVTSLRIHGWLLGETPEKIEGAEALDKAVSLGNTDPKNNGFFNCCVWAFNSSNYELVCGYNIQMIITTSSESKNAVWSKVRKLT
jgi:hypothetical protein